jgi:hypothetical protein
MGEDMAMASPIPNLEILFMMVNGKMEPEQRMTLLNFLVALSMIKLCFLQQLKTSTVI